MLEESLVQYYTDDIIKKSINKLNIQYFDEKVFNDTVLINEGIEPDIKMDIISLSAKRNCFKNFSIYGSKIIGSAFSGSQFVDFMFKNCEIIGNSFVCSNFNKFKMISETRQPYKSNNFSQSYFENCYFDNIHISQSTWLNSRIKSSIFSDCIFESCTLEGTIFKNCEFNNCIMHSANLDYMILDNTKLNDVVFPFYQFAYIIGSTKYLFDPSSSNIKFKCGKKIIDINEYKDCMYDLVHYYYDKGEFFPMCNLLIAINDIKTANEFAIYGINKALNEKNYRLIKHFCALCKFNNFLDYNLIMKLKDKINKFLVCSNLEKEQLNEAIMQTAEIISLINERTTNNTSLQIEIQTNIMRGSVDEHEKIEKLISDCIYIIDTPNLQAKGHTVTELSYCPITLLFEVIGTAANLISIASALQEFLVKIKKDKSIDSREVAKSIRKKYNNVNMVDIDIRIKLAKAEIEKSMLELKNYKGVKSNKKYDDFIENITQKIIGDVENIIDKDMLVLQVDC